MSNSKFIIPALIGTLCMTMTACSSDDEPTAANSFDPIEVSPEQSRTVERQNDFAFRLFKAASAQHDGNLAISPLGMSFAMSMVANGAEGKTLSEMLDAVGGGCTVEELNSLNSLLSERLPGIDPLTTVRLANSMWANNSLAVKPTFSSAISDMYRGNLFNTDLSSGQSVADINSWVSDKTSGMIPRMLDKPLGGEFALVNTVYFHGEWSKKFDKSLTTKRYFTNADGSKSAVDMMRDPDSGTFYLTGEKMHGTERVYGNGAYSITMLMPKDGVSLDACIDELAVNADEAYITRGATVTELRIPRINVEMNMDFIPAMKALGVNEVFGRTANLSGISDMPAYISELRQFTKFVLDEEGTMASSATYAKGEYIADIDAFVSLHFDRPFLYFITERSSGSILFMGKIESL